jgi:phage shock protein PspC (stress-responsive transcriptional regulator)
MIDIRHKKLRRSPREAIIFGIAAGLGHYFETDPVFIRLILIALAVLKLWPVVVLYGVLFFVMPIDPAQDTVASHQEPRDVTPTEHMDSSQNM